MEKLVQTHPGLASARLVDEKGGSGTPLHAATDWPGFFANGPEVVAVLIGAGADPNAAIEGSWHTETPLHWAASSDDVDVARALIDGGANIEAAGASIAGGRPLDNAVGYGCGRSPVSSSNEAHASTGLWQAAALGLRTRVDELIAAEAPTTQQLTDAFWQACHGGQRRMAEHLLALGAELNGTPSWSDSTPLDVADSLGTGRESLLSLAQGARRKEKGDRCELIREVQSNRKIARPPPSVRASLAAMSLAVIASLHPQPINALEENIMAATYTFDVFSSLDGFGSASGGDWGGYWGKQGPELLDHRLSLYGEEQRMVFGANTYRLFAQFLATIDANPEVGDPWVTRMVNLPATVVSNTLEASLDWPDATVAKGDAVDVVAQLKEESDVPLRSHGSLSMNRALMNAGLVDRVQLTIFPVITGQNGSEPIFQGAADFDLELLETRTLDGDIQELTYRPALHV